MTALSFVWVHPYSQNSRCDTTSRCLARDLAMPSTPDVSGMSNSCHGTSSSLIPWAATCNHHCALQVRFDLLQGLGLLLTDVHPGKQLSCWTSPEGLHLTSGRFTLAALLSPNHVVYRGVWGLKILLPVFIIIQ